MTRPDTNTVYQESEMVRGYLEGRDDFRKELPIDHNYSPSYVHGWLNGRDDRFGKPRDRAAALRARAEMILGAGTLT